MFPERDVACDVEGAAFAAMALACADVDALIAAWQGGVRYGE
jgi:hypothetical protein